jgi:hypothetical protein
MKIKYGAQATPGGALLISQSNIVTLVMVNGDLFSTGGASILLSTDTEGFWEYTWIPTGSAAAGWVLKPGPYQWSLTYGGKVRKGDTRSGSLVGPNSLLELPELLPLYGDYVVLGAVTGDFVVSIGAGMTVNVAAGYGLVRGVGVDNPSSRALNIAAAHATLPRIDTVVLELVRTVGTSEGKVTLKVVTGTANASPVAPTLTQDANTWQAPLYDVRVNALAVTPTSVTDRRGVPATTVSRNPTLLPVLRTSPGATSLTTTPTTVAALQHSVTLVSGVWYEVFCEATMQVASPGGFSAVMACFIEGTANAGASQSLASLTPEALENAHSRSVLGTGAAITCGVLLSELGGDALYYSGVCSVIAVPRT